VGFRWELSRQQKQGRQRNPSGQRTPLARRKKVQQIDGGQGSFEKGRGGRDWDVIRESLSNRRWGDLGRKWGGNKEAEEQNDGRYRVSKRSKESTD